MGMYCWAIYLEGRVTFSVEDFNFLVLLAGQWGLKDSEVYL